jgi:hypothetical protein
MSAGPDQKTAELMTRFLLGELSEEERPAVEQRFLSDNEFFNQLLVVEDSLIDDYLLGRLSDDRRQRAESLLRSSAAQWREVEFNSELIALLREARSEKTTVPVSVGPAIPDNNLSADAGTVQLAGSGEQRSATRATLALIVADFRALPAFYGATAALTLLLIFGVLPYLAFRSYSDRKDLLAQRAVAERNAIEADNKLAQQSRSASELAKELELERERRAQAEESLAQVQYPGPQPIMSVVLQPTAFERGGNSKTVTLTPGTKRIQLQLQVNQNQSHAPYNVTITTFEGQKVWSRNAIPASQIKHGRINLLLPSSLLKYDDYRAELEGSSEDGKATHVADYIFKVRK